MTPFSTGTQIASAHYYCCIDSILLKNAARLLVYDVDGQVGAETGEKLWQMPLAPEYGDQVKSKIADLKNVGIRAGSSITAALFLKEFVEKVGASRGCFVLGRGGTGFEKIV